MPAIRIRSLGQKMTEAPGRQVVIDTRPGASGIIGTEVAMCAPADGCTLHANMSQFATSPFLYKVSGDTLRDSAPISLVALAPQLLVMHPGVAGYALDNSWGVFARQSTPRPIIARLSAEIVRIHALQEMKERYAGLGLEATSGTPETFGDFVGAEADRFGKIIKATGAKVH